MGSKWDPNEPQIDKWAQPGPGIGLILDQGWSSACTSHGGAPFCFLGPYNPHLGTHYIWGPFGDPFVGRRPTNHTYALKNRVGGCRPHPPHFVGGLRPPHPSKMSAFGLQMGPRAPTDLPKWIPQNGSPNGTQMDPNGPQTNPVPGPG